MRLEFAQARGLIHYYGDIVIKSWYCRGVAFCMFLVRKAGGWKKNIAFTHAIVSIDFTFVVINGYLIELYETRNSRFGV